MENDDMIEFDEEYATRPTKTICLHEILDYNYVVSPSLRWFVIDRSFAT